MVLAADVTGLSRPMAFGSALAASLTLLVSAAPVQAQTPQVVADIAPVATLASAVLGAEVTPLVEPGADPHHFQLRPSQARGLGAAQAVFWLGHGISPWLERALEASAPKAVSVDLTDALGVTLRPFQFGTEAAGEAHTHEDHADTDETGHEAGHDHDHGSFDPHIWLDPENAVAMALDMAAVLSDLDPAGAASYAANAAKAAEEIRSNAAEANQILAPHHGAHLVVFHDAYAHWAAAFDVEVIAAIAEGDAAAPGAAAQRQLRALIADKGADCILIEPQHAPQLAETLAAETGTPIGRIDPMTSARPGDWFVSMAKAVADCLKAK